MDEQESPLERDHCLTVVLPGGVEKTTTVHGSKPVMDLLVMLCATYHLNPSDHSVELHSANRNHITFKANSPIGGLEVDKILLKPKESEEKVRRPYMPEATVRMLVNYKKSHKTVVRVNPRVPLAQLLPAVCEKCEFDVETTILLKDSDSLEPLDLTKSLNDYGVRELFAKDAAAVSPIDEIPSSPTPPPTPPPPTPQEVCAEDVILPQKEEKNEKKLKENKGFFSLFRRTRAKQEKVTQSAPPSPVVKDHAKAKALGIHTSSNSLAAASPTHPKKRRAPQPPMSAAQSMPANLNSITLKRPKRRAPPPPRVSTHEELPEDTAITGSDSPLSTVNELRESENMEFSTPTPPSPSSCPRETDSRPPHKIPHPVRGAVPEASLTLAQILTASLANGLPVRPTKSTATNHACNGGSHPHGGPFLSVRGSPLKLRPIPGGGPQKGGMTTFTVVPRGSLIKQRVLELQGLSMAVSELSLEQEEADSVASAVVVERRESQTQTEQEMLAYCSFKGSTPSPEAETDLPESDSECFPSGSWRTDSPSFSSDPFSSERQSFQTSPCSVEETEEDFDRRTAEQSVSPSERRTFQMSTSESQSFQTSTSSAEETEDDLKTVKEPWSPNPVPPASIAAYDNGLCVDVDDVTFTLGDRNEEYRFPPPPPPVFEETEEEYFSQEQEGGVPRCQSASPSLSEPAGGCRGAWAGVSRDSQPRKKVPDFATKLLKRTGSVPTRFAQAVALAMQRSQTGAHSGGQGPVHVPPCPERHPPCPIPSTD